MTETDTLQGVRRRRLEKRVMLNGGCMALHSAANLLHEAFALMAQCLSACRRSALHYKCRRLQDGLAFTVPDPKLTFGKMFL